MSKPANVEEFIAQKPEWSKEIKLLRKTILKNNLEETIKWLFPTYTLAKKNVVGIGAFKNYVGIWFFQGGLLKDEAKKLVNAQEGKTQAMRQWRFDSINEIKENLPLLEAYINEAIQNTKDGKKVVLKEKPPTPMPPEFRAFLKEHKKVELAFKKLNPSAKREYFEYISQAKRESTKTRRLEKIASMIIEGKGLHDKYK